MAAPLDRQCIAARPVSHSTQRTFKNPTPVIHFEVLNQDYEAIVGDTSSILHTSTIHNIPRASTMTHNNRQHANTRSQR
jgi:hypothetical protein